MDKWFKDILPDKDPYHNRGRDQMRKKGGGPEFECLCYESVPFNGWEQIKISLSEYFKFLFAYLVITYYSLQFLSNGDTK